MYKKVRCIQCRGARKYRNVGNMLVSCTECDEGFVFVPINNEISSAVSVEKIFEKSKEMDVVSSAEENPDLTFVTRSGRKITHVKRTK